MFRVDLADHPHDAFAADDLAVFANSTNACSDFHDCLSKGRSTPKSVEPLFVVEKPDRFNFCSAPRIAKPQAAKRRCLTACGLAIRSAHIPQGARPSVRISAPTSVTATVCSK